MQPSSPFERGFTPYAPPAAAPGTGGAYGVVPSVDGVTLPGAQVVLYTPGAVALATFFGTLLGGSVIMTMNERRLGRSKQGALTMLYGVLGTIVLMGISFALPTGLAGAPFGIASLLAMRAIAEKRQGAIVKAHQASGGRVGSNWAAFGISLICLMAVLVPVFVIAFVAAILSPDAG